jgi:protein-S-isoprenylcysteine O-methyltransferase Ste14
MAPEAKQDRAGVIAPPPLLVFGHVLAGFGLGRLWPWTVGHSGLSLVTGWGLILSACGLAFWGITRMHQAGTAVNPARPTTALVTHGPYGWSRNPLYLALLMVHGGIGLAAGNLWILTALIPAWALLRWGVIAREERYLEAKFGEQYNQYRQRVRRWF